jgi:hypothetical protein
MDQRLRSISDLVRRAGRCAGIAVLSLLLADPASPSEVASPEGEKEAAAKELSLNLAGSGGGALGRSLFGRHSGAAGARFGLGLDFFFERQESLRIASMESAITVRDLARGGEESGVLHGDPGLLNRKFDIVWEMEGAGVEFPIALPRLGGFAYSTLVLQAATADVSLDFLDRTRAQDSSSLGGRGALLGAEVNVGTAPSPSRPWFTEASYGFQKLPNFTVDRSLRFGPEGFEVLEDEVRLGREAQEIATRIGYSFSGNRVTAYTGVLHRWTDLEIEDELRYRDPLRATETHLSSRTELEREATLGLAGVNYRLGPRLHSRLETSVGEGDWGVVFKVVHLGPESEPEDGTKEDPGNAEIERRLSGIADAIAPQLAIIEARFLADWESLAIVEGPDGQPAYLVREVRLLLDQTERALVDVLKDYSELEALTDWVNDEFRRVRVDLQIETETELPTRLPAKAPAVLVTVAELEPLQHLSLSTRGLQHAQARERTREKRKADPIRDRIRDDVRKLGKLQARLVFKSYLGKGGQLRLFPRRKRREEGKLYAPNTEFVISAGSYSWEITQYGKKKAELNCDGNSKGPAAECPLDIISRFCVVLSCNRVSCVPEDCL